MKIGVLSDPHSRSDLQALAVEKLIGEGAEALLHAGDLCIEENLRRLKESGLPYAAVFGNNDSPLLPLAGEYRIRQEPWYFKVGDLKVKMMHLPYYLTPDADLVVYGHTHRFSCERKGETLFLNPGEICAREAPSCSCVLLERKERGWEILRFILPTDVAAPVWERERRFLPF
ncbi:YfcE family phosphodiesterase [Nitratifractor sp.]